ncbi:hypothetical protein [Methylovorus glucosotrophus]|uniref:DNA methylase adenine-specific domain-containing protein n=1 Tax=Methylovorus glucosotrophus (strain SIP3-4) TaxID=582744 RepID=C6X7Y6_METGS|nr:hypothetical protein [Methylovorus glucosotrophus]ACT51313.1 hypothetical protein Msip34_2071 [Methylovorus glucosotrophus SIP3-4]
MQNKNEKTISKLIEQIIQKSNFRSNPKDVFDDIIQLTFNTIFSHQFQFLANENGCFRIDSNLYNELTDYKKNPEAWELLQEASLLFISMFTDCEPFTDILGVIYDKYLGKTLGQFLTPPAVAYGVGKFIYGDIKPITKHILVGDQGGCGSGAMILGFLRLINETQGKEAFKHLEIINMDVDYRMVQLSSIQIVLHCLFHDYEIFNLQTHWGNAITEYNGRKDGSGTLALYWNQDPKYTEAIRALNILEEETEKQYA